MATPRSLIRSTLGDGGARDAAPDAAPEAAGSEKSEDQRASRSDVRARLDALRVNREGDGLPRPPPLPLYDGPGLETVLGAQVRETERGPFVFVERRIALDRKHGIHPLSLALGLALPFRHSEREAGGPDRLLPEDAYFLDTETTGLSGGTGTVAFLVGTGRVEGESFVLRQYGMRDFPEEAALLEALATDLGTTPLVTFNGRSFDWPLLETRFRLHRLAPGRRPHLDLLPPSRRLWAKSLASHRLVALEQEILHFHRHDDLASELVPQAYFDYLRGRDPRTVARAFAHNEDDVLSMLALMGHLARALDRPTARDDASAGDAVGTSRFLIELGRDEDARACLEHALLTADPGEARVLLKELGHHCRRRAAWDAALGHFQHLATLNGRFELDAYEHVAKILEHRRKDFQQALDWVERALRLAPPHGHAEAALRHREARLKRRLERARRQCSQQGA